MTPYDVRHFRTDDGTDVFGEWFDSLPDRPMQQRIAVRIDRLAVGLFGDAKPLREGVCELRIDHGPGYRVYYGVAGRAVVLLLCGGAKRTQQRDIGRAVAYWREFKARQK